NRKNGTDVAIRFRSQCQIENTAHHRVTDQITEDALRVVLSERRFARTQRMIQITKGAPERRQTEHADVIPQRFRVVGTKEARCIRLMPDSMLPLEDSNGGQQPQHAIEWLRLSTGAFCKCIRGLRLVTDEICNS